MSGLPGGGRWEVIGAVSGARESLRGAGGVRGVGGESGLRGVWVSGEGNRGQAVKERCVLEGT